MRKDLSAFSILVFHVIVFSEKMQENHRAAKKRKKIVSAVCEILFSEAAEGTLLEPHSQQNRPAPSVTLNNPGPTSLHLTHLQNNCVVSVSV